jgi:hypothetical protein
MLKNIITDYVGQFSHIVLDYAFFMAVLLPSSNWASQGVNI